MLRPIAGSVYNAVKMSGMKTEWNLRKQNPTMPKKDEVSLEIQRLREDLKRTRRAHIISAIDSKLKAGGELSTEELAYLKDNHPQLYEEAMEIQRERQAYKRELGACRTKEDVSRVNAQKLQNFVSTAKAVTGNASISGGDRMGMLDQILRRVMGVQSEHIRFLRTKQYADLPQESELREERKKKKARESSTGSEDGNAEIAQILYQQLRDELLSYLGAEPVIEMESARDAIDTGDAGDAKNAGDAGDAKNAGDAGKDEKKSGGFLKKA